MLDLFGTLVTAPTPAERHHAADRLAGVIGCTPQAVEGYFLDTSQIHHDGTLATVPILAAHLVRAVGGQASAVNPVTEELHVLGRTRVVPSDSVIES